MVPKLQLSQDLMVLAVIVTFKVLEAALLMVQTRVDVVAQEQIVWDVERKIPHNVDLVNLIKSAPSFPRDQVDIILNCQVNMHLYNLELIHNTGLHSHTVAGYEI